MFINTFSGTQRQINRRGTSALWLHSGSEGWEIPAAFGKEGKRREEGIEGSQEESTGIKNNGETDEEGSRENGGRGKLRNYCCNVGLCWK